MKTSVSLVLPFFNEFEYIPITVAKAQAALDTIGIDYEIILVNDASSDKSETIAEQLSNQDSRIKLFHHKRNRGLGAALKTGFENASKDIIIYSDMDMPFDFSILSDRLSLLEENDVVHGYRIGKRESLLRTIYSEIYNTLIRLIFGYKIKDINFAMTIFKRNILEKFSLRANGSFISAEFLLKSYYNGYKVVNIPVTFNPRIYGRSRLTTLDNILKILYELVKFYPEIRSLRYQINN